MRELRAALEPVSARVGISVIIPCLGEDEAISTVVSVDGTSATITFGSGVQPKAKSAESASR